MALAMAALQLVIFVFCYLSFRYNFAAKHFNFAALTIASDSNGALGEESHL